MFSICERTWKKAKKWEKMEQNWCVGRRWMELKYIKGCRNKQPQYSWSTTKNVFLQEVKNILTGAWWAILYFLISPFPWVYINHIMTACHFRECQVGWAPTLYLLSFWFSSSIRSWYFAISDWMELRNVLLWSVSIGSSWKQKKMIAFKKGISWTV